jgi:Tol biopolymer transport system component
MNLENILKKIKKGKNFIRNGLIAGLISSSLLIGCSKLKPEAKNELSSYTKVLSEEEIKDISAVEKDKLIFSEPVSFSPGDIIVYGISDITPDGILRKVTKISPDKKIIYTENASLEETVKNADFELEISPPSGKFSLVTEKGISEEIHKSNSLNIKFNLENVVLLDIDGDKSTKEDQIVANGDFEFHSNSFVNCIIREHSLSELSFKNKSDVEYGLKISALNTFEDIDEEIKIAQYNFPSFVAGYIPGTPVPIIIRPKLELFAGVNGSISPIETSVTQKSSIKSGICYKNGKWDKEGDFSTSFKFSPPNTPEISDLKGYIKPKLNFFVYGIAGPYGELDGFLKINSGELSWELHGGLEANLGINAEFFSKNLENYYANILNYSKLLVKKEKKAAKEEIAKEGKVRKEGSEKIVYVSGTEESAEIYVMNSDGTNKKNLTNNDYWDSYPSWSPDGTKILFQSERNYNEWRWRNDEWGDIYIMNADGSEQKKLTDVDYEIRILGWSLKGNRIILHDEKEGFCSINLDGSDIKFLNADDPNIPVIYKDNETKMKSPDRKKILEIQFGRSKSFGPGEIVESPEIIDIANGKRIKIPHPPGDYQFGERYIEFSWSNDSKKILFSFERDRRFKLYYFDIEKNVLNEIRGFQNPIGNISWSSDGEKVLFLMEDEGKHLDIYVTNLNGTELKNLTNTKYIHEYLASWQPSSKLERKIFGKEKKDIEVGKSRTLEDYFLKGRELEGISLAPIGYLENELEKEIKSNPYFLNQEEIKDVGSDLGYNPLKAGIAAYAIRDKKIEDPALLYLLLFQFDSESEVSNLVSALKKSEQSYYETTLLNPVFFSKDDIFALMKFDNIETVNQMNSIINCLGNYTERISPEFIFVENKELNKEKLIPFLEEKKKIMELRSY